MTGDGMSGDAMPGGAPVLNLSAMSIDFGAVGCGAAAPASKTLTVTNMGGSTLAVSASEVGSAFTLFPTTLSLGHGMSGTFTLGASIPGSAMAGVPVTGSLQLFTNDPAKASVVLVLTATPTGATLTSPSGISSYTFAAPEIGLPAPTVAVQLKNSGNAAATFTIGSPSDPSVTLSGLPDGGGVTLNAGDTLSAVAAFTPTSGKTVSATSTISAVGPVCGASLASLKFNGVGAMGNLVGWPSNGTLDFGLADCNGMAPAPKKVTLKNTSTTTDARITAVDTSAIGMFTADATVGAKVAAGSSLDIHFTAPAVPAAPMGLAAITGKVVIHTDADSAATGNTIQLTEEPQGAILAFSDPSTPGCTTTANFGTFGATGILLQPVPPQNFCVVNKGNAPANVTLIAGENTGDAGAAGASVDGGADATVDAGAGSGLPPVFSPLPAAVQIAAMAAGSSNPTVAQESLTFTPEHANATVGSLAMAVDSMTTLCAPLPAPVPLSGSAVGGGPVVAPTNLAFPATCGGAAPGAQTFVISNSGTVNMTWTMSGVMGPGAAQYTVSASPPPGLLAPNGMATVTVTALAVPSPAPNPNPAALSAQVVVNTDVPYDPPHIVALTEVPVGDQLAISTGNLRFGQVPLSLNVSQNFTLTNNANPGSPDARVTWTITGAGLGAYSLPQQTGGSLSAGSSATESESFTPTAAGPYPATLALSTTDALCAALPAAITLSGTGTSGTVTLSATKFAFGAAGDPLGLVNCGATGTPQTLTISNTGNQAFNIVTVSLGKGGSSPFVLSGPASSAPLALPIGGSTSLTITPSIIPTGATPGDPTAFGDTLTITTDAAGDSAHAIPLAMQARGAVIASTPLQTDWTFGSVGAGSIGTFFNTIQNTGNAPASVVLQGLSYPTIFGLQNNPTTVPPNSIATLVGQFTPPVPNGNWSDRGQLVVTGQPLCGSLPSQWVIPAITLSGSSTGSAVLTLNGSLTFPTTDCGSAPPAGQSVTLTNVTNHAYPYTVKFNSGAFYTLSDPSAGMLAANGIATIVVNPKTLQPGPGVFPGSAPYADDLLITVATTPPISFTLPISWTLNGAVLTLPDGPGPNLDAQGAFYIADTTSGFDLPIANSGTATASVDFAIHPSGAFTVQPTPPTSVLPGITALPELVGGSASVACTAGTTNATATFQYSGPVCQPLPLTGVAVRACTGTYTGIVGGADAGAESDAGGSADGGGDAMQVDAPADAGQDATVTDAGAADASDATSSMPTPCTSAPCSASGDNSVQCTQSLNGVCSPTEAIIVAADISAGAISGSALTAGSCYACMVGLGGLDDTTGDTNQECGDLAAADAGVPNGIDGEPAAQTCVDTFSCIVNQACGTAAAGATPCYCGSATAAACEGTAGAANGKCVQQEVNGLPFGTGQGTCTNVYPAALACTEGDSTGTNKAFTNAALPAGRANTLAGFAASNCSTACKWLH
jgi:hypothetical protein